MKSLNVYMNHKIEINLPITKSFENKLDIKENFGEKIYPFGAKKKP